LDSDYALEFWVDVAKKIRDNRGTFFFIGNGASATMAEHLSHDCFQNADMLTYTCSETSHITAIANDLSYEDVFSYRISKAFNDKDMLIAISSSGNSPNIVKAIKTAKELGGYVVTITGKSADNKSRSLGDLNFHIKLDTYGMVEAAHSVLLHCWLDMFLDKYLGGRH
jgi:D-sedoheptulose 7-phosphate isomerase